MLNDSGLLTYDTLGNYTLPNVSYSGGILRFLSRISQNWPLFGRLKGGGYSPPMKGGVMKNLQNLLFIGLLLFLTTISGQVFAQETKTNNGIAYTIIDPATFAFNADSGSIKVGQKYYLEGKVLTISGANLYITDVGMKTAFILNAPLKLDYGANIKVYVEISEASSYSVKAKIIKIEGTGVPTTTTQAVGGTKALDDVTYTVISPVDFAFNADSGTIKAGQKYYIEGKVLTISGANLYITDVGMKTVFILSAPLKLDYGAGIKVYAEISEASSYSVKARIVKIETR
jgi:hypothetical protein